MAESATKILTITLLPFRTALINKNLDKMEAIKQQNDYLNSPLASTIQVTLIKKDVEIRKEISKNLKI